MARVSEQGNTLGFVLVGALLVALLLGGIYVVRNNMAQVATSDGDTAPTVASNDDSTDSESTTGGDSKTTDTKTDEQRLKETLEAQSTAEKKAKDQQAANNSKTTTSTSGNTATATTDKLPATGPEEALLQLVGATLVAGTGIAYARSRRLI